MTLASARQDRANLNEFEYLSQSQIAIVATTQEWMTRLTVLFGAVQTTDRPEVTALRDKMIAELRAVLGV